jgi:hypothetical protein
MKKSIALLLFLAVISACKKLEFAPEGPTDVRVTNISGSLFDDVNVNTSKGNHTMGNIVPGGTSDYYRFEVAYPKAEISAKINGVLYTTGKVEVTYMQYIGQERITYLVDIANSPQFTLEIKDVIYEEPLTLK